MHRLSADPRLWNIFRRVLEADFKEEKAVIKRELFPYALTTATRLGAGQRPTLLDLGCGTGELAPIFLRNNYDYLGVDIEQQRIDYAQRVYPEGRFQVMDASALLCDDNQFDQILVTGVLHHLADSQVRSILAEMRRVLRPGGRALVMEDTATGFKLNMLGALVHLADEGSFIRKSEQYAALYKPFFQIRAAYQIRSGVCDYQVFVLEKEGEER